MNQKISPLGIPRDSTWSVSTLTAIEAYLGEVGGFSTAVAVSDDLRRKCRRLADLPGILGTDRSELRHGIRSTPHRNYVILFRYTEDAVEIVNILHASRDVTTHYEED